MKLQIRKKHIDLLIAKKHDIYLSYWQKNELGEKLFEMDVAKWDKKALADLKIIVWKYAEEDSACKNLVKQLTTYEQLRANPEGTKLKKVKDADTPIKDYIFASAHHWLFREHDDKNLYPYFVSDVRYVSPSRYNRAHVRIDCHYIHGNKKEGVCISLYVEHVRGRTVKEMLEGQKWYVENDSIFKIYEKELDTYRKYSAMIGEQFVGKNIGFLKSDGYYRWKRDIFLSKEGINARLVVDTDFSKEVKDYTDLCYSAHEEDEDEEGGKKKSKKDEEPEVPFEPMLPIHLFVDCFYLQEHTDIYVHVNNITPYVYDDKVGDKLVLPTDTKDLIDIMMTGTKDLLEDIVVGKKGGIIILATGHAGTGKTLTAEVYSEIMKRPLYVVPSHQLGIGVDELEKNLRTILGRASRWRAILLIDEADVYIHERGDDIEQNAIVGIFLRILEYYNGILFMTSNRATIIDDAILSRATAHIRYEKPEGEELKRIWKVLSTQFQVKMDDALIEKSAKELTGMSGRDIKNLLKLTRLLSIRREKPVDMEMLKFASKFQDFQTKK